MEYLIPEFIDRLNIIHLLPYEMRRIKINTQRVAVQYPEYFTPVCRRSHDILPAGPLILSKKHGTVLDGYPDSLLFGIRKDRRPYFSGFFQIIFQIPGRHSADKRSNQMNAQ